MRCVAVFPSILHSFFLEVFLLHRVGSSFARQCLNCGRPLAGFEPKISRMGTQRSGALTNRATTPTLYCILYFYFRNEKNDLHAYLRYLGAYNRNLDLDKFRFISKNCSMKALVQWGISVELA